MSGRRRKPMTLDAIGGPAEPAAVERAGQGADSVADAGGRRAHVKQLTLYLPHPVYRQLRELAFHEERRMHSLLLEGLDRLFADRGARSIAQLTQDE